MSLESIQSFNWHSYSSQLLESTGSAQPWRMTIGADWAPIRRFADLVLNDPSAVYGDLLPLFKESDFNIFNVEAVLCDMPLEVIPKNGPALQAKEKTVAALQAANCHLACLANNHSMDFGVAGLESTIKTLHAAGIPSVGAGVEEDVLKAPAIHICKGTRVAIINCGEGEACRSRRGGPGALGFDVGAEILRIQELRKSDLVDVIVFIFHGGREYIPVPPPYVVQSLRQIAESGVDAVIAHHPHVPQGVEIYKGVPIAYSLGNFVFWQESDLYSRHTGYLVHLDFEGERLCNFGLTPYSVTSEGLRQMDGASRAIFSERMERASAPLQSMRDVEACWAAFVDSINIKEFCLVHGDVMQAVVDDSAPASAAEVMKVQNLFFTPAHSNLASELFERHVKGQRGSAPSWATDLLRCWMETKHPGVE